jgi:hypothetical protein
VHANEVKESAVIVVIIDKHQNSLAFIVIYRLG